MLATLTKSNIRLTPPHRKVFSCNLHLHVLCATRSEDCVCRSRISVFHSLARSRFRVWLCVVICTETKSVTDVKRQSKTKAEIGGTTYYCHPIKLRQVPLTRRKIVWAPVSDVSYIQRRGTYLLYGYKIG